MPEIKPAPRGADCEVATVVVGKSGPDFERRQAPRLSGWQVWTEGRLAGLPAGPEVDALRSALLTEGGGSVIVVGRVDGEQTTTLSETLRDSSLSEPWLGLLQLELDRRELALGRKGVGADAYLEQLDRARRLAETPGDVGDLAALFAIDATARCGVRCSPIPDLSSSVVDLVMDVQDDETFQLAIETLAGSKAAVELNERTLDRIQRSLRSGWTSPFEHAVTVYALEQAIEGGNPDMAAEWAGLYEALVVGACERSHPTCAALVREYEEVLGRVAVLDEVEVHSPVAAAVRAAVMCNDLVHPAPGSLEVSLGVGAIASEISLADCIIERYGRSECVVLALQMQP